MTVALPTRRATFAMGLATALAGCGDFARTQTLRSTDAQPDGYPTVEGVREMARLVRERTDGRLNVKLYPGGQLGGETDALEIAIFGGVDFTRVNIASLNAIAPETIVATLPFLFRSTAHMRVTMDGPPGDAILAALRPHGLEGLCFYDSGARSFYTRAKPILTPDDLRGQKIRVMNSEMYVAMVDALGAAPTPMPFSEVYQGLITGVVDGAENNWPSLESSRHFEAIKYYSLTQHTMAPEVLCASGLRWAKLSVEDQELIRRCAKESVPVMRRAWDARTEASEAAVRASGVEVIEPDIGPFQERARPLWDRFLTTPHMREIADAILATETPDE